MIFQVNRLSSHLFLPHLLLKHRHGLPPHLCLFQAAMSQYFMTQYRGRRGVLRWMILTQDLMTQKLEMPEL
jgi:hypothetical protein